jgi:hypothetical protein
MLVLSNPLVDLDASVRAAASLRRICGAYIMIRARHGASPRWRHAAERILDTVRSVTVERRDDRQFFERLRADGSSPADQRLGLRLVAHVLRDTGLYLDPYSTFERWQLAIAEFSDREDLWAPEAVTEDRR